MNFGRKRPCPFSPKFKQMVDSMLMIDVARRWTMAQVAACDGERAAADFCRKSARRHM